MIMRFDLENGGKAIADVDSPSVFARSLQDPLARRRQGLQVNPRALIAAVLRPHHREDAELGQRRLASERFDDSLIFVSGESVLRDKVVGNRHREVASARSDTAFTADSNSTSPSALPIASSQARSGCGINPTTFLPSLQIPAMLFSDPFGLAAAVR